MARGPVTVQPERSCYCKVRHVTRADAKGAAQRLRAAGEVVSVYHCPFCDGWHVGHRCARDVRARGR